MNNHDCDAGRKKSGCELSIMSVAWVYIIVQGVCDGTKETLKITLITIHQRPEKAEIIP